MMPQYKRQIQCFEEMDCFRVSDTMAWYASDGQKIAFMVKYNEHYGPVYSIHGWLPIPRYKVELERSLDNFSPYSNK